MQVKLLALCFLLAVASLASGCGLAKNLTGQNAGTVSELWSDVPALDGATKANIDIPLPLQLIIQGFIQAANADKSNTTKLDKFDFIAFQTDMTPQQVGEFYTLDKMKAAGWNAEDMPGCATGADTSGAASAAGFCVFGKTGDGGKSTALMIIPFKDDNQKQTQVFFVRFEATEKK